MDGQQVQVSSWPDVDFQTLSLEDVWQLHVLSAQALSIMRNRDMKNFEEVMKFLDTTHRLLPRLVPAIKHMKIQFGLKSMIIMWMLKEGRGMVHIVSKIVQFFPNKLPQYEDQCSQREMFLMRKNHADFQSLAQTLAINKEKLEDYIKNEMEEQYGERYAQKVEDRLMDYLHELEKGFPGDSYIEKIMKKQSAETEEDKFLLEVLTPDSSAVRKLLYCDVPASCPQAARSQSENGNKGAEPCWPSESSLHGGPSKTLLQSGEGNPLLDVREDKEGGSSTDVGDHQQPEEREQAFQKLKEERKDRDEEVCIEKNGECAEDGTSYPQFCSKHQRWVKNILRGCPDDYTEELLHQSNLSSSPGLFPSSSTSLSSQDLTPSNLVLSRSDQTPSNTSTHLQPSEAADTGDALRPGFDAAAQPTPPQDSVLSTLLFPVVQLVDIASSCRSHLTSVSKQLSANHLSMFGLKEAPSSSHPLASSAHRTSENQNLLKSPCILQTAPANQHMSAHSWHISGQQAVSRLSVKFRRNASSDQFVKDLGPFPPSSSNACVSEPAVHHASENLSSVCAANPSHLGVQQNSIKLHPKTRNSRTSQSSFCSGLSVSSSPSRASYLKGHRLRAPSRIQTDHQQPYVGLTRLSAEECLQATEGRASARRGEPSLQHDDDEERMEMFQDADCSFDINALYSSDSSSSECEDSASCDPDYRPHINETRLRLENQRLLNQM
ncbi:hypothetical protein CRENBAI_020632 [Crenichthys baileyi]|uniref:TERF1-interacting nuclear factor 2 N-terminal domain-containing protein n=1 Tax=Crenichthys baileyi TaxID=28760 RepID=A0AAV9RU40_9TELE